MTRRETISNYIIEQLKVKKEPDALYRLHWEAQDDKDRKPMRWETLLDAIDDEVDKHGYRVVLDALYVEPIDDIEARIIGETSAGLTAIEIYRADTLIYSHDYFANGATDAEYKAGLLESYDDAMACEDCESWDGCDDGTPHYDDADTTHVIATYSPRTGWTVEIPEHYGSDCQSYDWINANRDRLPADAVAAWDKYYG